MTTPLTTDLVSNPSYCRLDMRLAANVLDVMIYNPLEDNSLVTASAELPCEDGARLKAIETFIYDNPLLLSYFKMVTVVVESYDFVVVPRAVAEGCRHIDILRQANPDTESRAVILDDALDEFDADILTSMDAPEVNFLRRTFPNVRIYNSLYPFTRYCHANFTKGNMVKAFVDIRQSSLDIAVMSAGTLYLLNKFRFHNINDALYYILAATDDKAADDMELLLTGDRASRDALMPMLRQFKPYVMPMIFPSAMFRAGASAMQLPFDLVILPLCE